MQLLVFLKRDDDRPVAVGYPHVEVDVGDRSDRIAHVANPAEDPAAGNLVLGIDPVDDLPVLVALLQVQFVLVAQVAFGKEDELKAERCSKRAKALWHFPAVELLAFIVAVEDSIDLAVDSAEGAWAVFEAFPHRVILLVA